MAVDVLLGLQWGDEGKGKIVDYLSNKYDLVCRFQGGPNAGHTIIIGEQKFVLHTIPSGIFRENVINLIGNGVVIDPITLCKEMANLDNAQVAYQDRLLVANKAHLILPTHKYLDAASEAAKGTQKIGSTLKGIGPTYMDKTGRNGLRFGDVHLPGFEKKYSDLKAKHLEILKIYPSISFDLEAMEQEWFESIEILRKLKHVNGEYYINKAIKSGKKILAEGAQGSMLDIDFGTYPFVTSSNTVTSGVCNGLGIAPQHIGEVIGICKAYCTRVGGGPFPTEQLNDIGQKLGEIGHEFGATTGRARRCGWIDIPQVKYTIMINGVTQIALTKLDVLNTFKEIAIAEDYRYDNTSSEELPYDLCQTNVNPSYTQTPGWEEEIIPGTAYKELPSNAIKYVERLEELLGVKISMVSAGPERTNLILRD